MSKGQISDQMPDLFRLCSDFDVQQVKNRSMHCIPYFRAKILNFFAFFEKLQLRDAIKSNYQGGLCKEFNFFICSLPFSYIKGRVFYSPPPSIGKRPIYFRFFLLKASLSYNFSKNAKKFSIFALKEGMQCMLRFFIY